MQIFHFSQTPKVNPQEQKQQITCLHCNFSDDLNHQITTPGLFRLDALINDRFPHPKRSHTVSPQRLCLPRKILNNTPGLYSSLISVTPGTGDLTYMHFQRLTMIKSKGELPLQLELPRQMEQNKSIEHNIKG